MCINEAKGMNRAMKEELDDLEKGGKMLARKKKKAVGKFWIAMLILCLGLTGFAGYKLTSIIMEYKSGADEYEDLQKYITSDLADEVLKETDLLADGEAYVSRVNFEELKEINEEIIAWIEIPDTVINYPILQREGDNAYYLKHTFQHKVNNSGAIFMEAKNSPDFSDYHTIIYGHNMRVGTMFGTLDEYESPTFLAAHPYIYVDVEEGLMKYQVFSCYKTTAKSNTYTIGFEPDKIYEDFLATIKERSEYDTGVDVSVEDKILTLSTCSEGAKGNRFVVHAKRV